MRVPRYAVHILCAVVILVSAAPLKADWFVFGPSNGGFVLIGRFPEPGPHTGTVCDGSGDCQSGSGEEFCESCHARPATTRSSDLASQHLRTFFPRIESPVAGSTPFAGGTLERRGGALLWRSQGAGTPGVAFPAGARLVRTRNGKQRVVYEGSAPPTIVR